MVRTPTLEVGIYTDLDQTDGSNITVLFAYLARCAEPRSEQLVVLSEFFEPV